MKYLLICFFCLVSFQQLDAQSLSLFDVDASNFPTMKAKFFAFDAIGKQQQPGIAELSLKENTIPRTITTVTCPPPQLPIALSSVLVIDVSGSMGNGDVNALNMDLAKAASKAWINGLPLGQSECAITSFDGFNYLNQDFTADKAMLLNAITTLSPQGGTDYDAALINSKAGGLLISKNGKHKRVIILLTDGQPYKQPQVSSIINQANIQNCAIYCVTLGMFAPQSLKDIANATGGLTFENVTTVKQAEDVYKSILLIAQGGSPCELTWTSDVSCADGDRTVESTWQGISSSTFYTPPANAIISLSVTPNFVVFVKCLPFTQKDTTLVLSPQNADITVNKINRKFGSVDFTVINTSFPIFIPKNTGKSITLRFEPKDSNYTYASFEIETDKCPSYFSASGGFAGRNIGASTLKLTKPNGGEIFAVGNDTLITWEGVAPSDTVNLEYSYDNGSTWKLLTGNATGLKYSWKNIPKPTSSSCLIRVSQKHSPPLIELKGHTNWVTGIAYSPDGNRVVTASSDKTAKIWDAKSGALIRTLTGHTEYLHCVTFSPDGTQFATGSGDFSAKIWDASSGTIIRTMKSNNEVKDVDYSPDGTSLAVAYTFSGITEIRDVNTGNLIKTLNGPATYDIISVAYSPDGNQLATAVLDRKITVWNPSTGQVIRTLTGHSDRPSGLAYSPDGSRLASVSYDRTAKIWDANTGVLIRTLSGHNKPISSVAFSPNGTNIATSSFDSTIKIWDANTGAVINTLRGHQNRVNKVVYSPDGLHLASASGDSTARIWATESSAYQEDISDAVFTVVASSPQSKDIDMGQILVTNVRDSVVPTFVQNSGTYPFRVDSISITGADANQFSLVSGIPPFGVLPGVAKAVEFRFRPSTVGVKTAQLLVFTPSDTLRQSIKGEGIEPLIEVLGNVIDFGQVDVGKQKDTLRAVTIKNIGTIPLTINTTRHAGPNTANFTTHGGGGAFTLVQGDTARLDLRFSPTDIGRTSGRLLFEYNGIGSPATVQLFGEGINDSNTVQTLIGIRDISAQAGEKVNLALYIASQKNMQIPGAPKNFSAKIHYNKTILFNEQTSNICSSGTDDSCVLELTGIYDPKSSDLISIPCIATLGNTDNSTLVIDEFSWTNGTVVPFTETQNGTIHITGICEDGGVRLFIPSKNSTSLSTRPNPAQNSIQIQYGLREPLSVTLELLDITGQVVQTIVSNQQQAAGQYTLPNDLSLLGNGVYSLRLTTNKEVLTTRVDIIK